MTFDFDIAFRLSEKIDIRSHDFVEFYFILNGKRHQIGCGYTEDFVRETTAHSLRFQANGRDFLGQFFNLPFLNAKWIDTTVLTSFCEKIIDQSYTVGGDPNGTYLKEYCKIRGLTRTVVDDGAHKGTVNIPELSDTKIAPILQSVAEEVLTIPYQNRLGQMVLWGRDSLDKNDTGYWLSDTNDSNVLSMQVRQNYSKVFSEVKIQYNGGEGGVGYAHTASRPVFNSDPRARQIFQPEIRSFQNSTLTTTAGEISVDPKRDQLAASVLRKSNQNLNRVVIKTSLPFYVAKDGRISIYEVNQLYNIKSEAHGVSEKMRLIGIGYTQDASQLIVELCFIPKDALI